jgi:hypothetical protein
MNIYADRTVILLATSTLADVAAEWAALGLPANPAAENQESYLGGFVNTPVQTTPTGERYCRVRVLAYLGPILTGRAFTTCQVLDADPVWTYLDEGGQIVTVQMGTVAGDTPVDQGIPSEEMDAIAQHQVDSAAGQVDAKYTTVTGNQAMIYCGKQMELVDWLAAVTPTLDDMESDALTFCFPGLRAEREAMKVTAPATTDVETVLKVQAEIRLWKQLLYGRESQRRIGKERIKAAVTATEKAQARDNAIAILGSI